MESWHTFFFCLGTHDQPQREHERRKHWLKNIYLTNVKVYCNLQNVHTWSKYKGYDPEVGSLWGNGLIKIVTGIRRCGKSYLLFKLFRDHLLADGISPDHIISLALDDILNDEYCDPKKLLHYIKGNIKDSEIHYVLLDEVQMVNNFVGALNSLLHIDNVDVYVTGSNSKFLSSDIATEFRGRGDEIRIYPLSFSEYVSAYDGNKE